MIESQTINIGDSGAAFDKLKESVNNQRYTKHMRLWSAVANG